MLYYWKRTFSKWRLSKIFFYGSAFNMCAFPFLNLCLYSLCNQFDLTWSRNPLRFEICSALCYFIRQKKVSWSYWRICHFDSYYEFVQRTKIDSNNSNSNNNSKTNNRNTIQNMLWMWTSTRLLLWFLFKHTKIRIVWDT